MVVEMESDYVMIDDLELSEESEYKGVMYCDKPFTGTAYDDWQDIHTEWTFISGQGEGRWFSVFDNGQLQEEIILDKGNVLRSKNWTKKGELLAEYQSNPFYRVEYFPSGRKKYYEDDRGYIKYFESGKIKKRFIYLEKYATIYDENEIWLVKHKSNGEKYLVFTRENMTFHDEYISVHYLELLKKNLTPVLYYTGYEDFYPYFLQWLPVNDGTPVDKQTTDIICNMITCNELAIKYDGMNLARQYKVQKAIPFIEKEKDNHESPPGYGNKSYGFTIGQIARIALSELVTVHR